MRRGGEGKRKGKDKSRATFRIGVRVLARTLTLARYLSRVEKVRANFELLSDDIKIFWQQDISIN